MDEFFIVIVVIAAVIYAVRIIKFFIPEKKHLELVYEKDGRFYNRKKEPYTGVGFFIDNKEDMYIGNFLLGEPILPVRSYYYNGQLKIEKLLEWGRCVGSYFEYYPSGKVKALGDLDRQGTGSITFFSSSGEIIDEKVFEKGKDVTKERFKNMEELEPVVICRKNKFYSKQGKLFSGSGQFKDESGNIMRAHFIKGQIDGSCYGFYPDGRIKGESMYKKGIRIGKYYEYYQNGEIWAEGSFEEDGSGVIAFYSAKGEKTGTQVYKKNQLIDETHFIKKNNS